MNIAIEARALSTQGGGVKVYTQELLRALATYQNQARMAAIYAHTKDQKHDELGYEVISVPIRSELEIFFNTWLTYRVQGALKPFKPDLVHYTKAAIPSKLAYPSVVTIHDVIPLLMPFSQAVGPRVYWPHTLKEAAKASQHIFTISEASRKDIVTHFNIDPNKITVTPLAVNHDVFKPQSAQSITDARATLGVPTPYILFVATRDMRKNIDGLLSAFAKLAHEIPHTLVIAGKLALRHDNSEQRVVELALKKRVLFLDFVPAETLPGLYAGADLFVFPSVYEGWGLPPLEAMACGTPTIVSNGGALPEVVGQASIIVPFTVPDLMARLKDTDFIDALAKAMRSVLDNKNLQEKMRQDGFKQAAAFSWQLLAQKTWQVYKELTL